MLCPAVVFIEESVHQGNHLHSTGHYKQIILENGIEIIAKDLSRVYFGDYYLVRLEIICRFLDAALLTEGTTPGKMDTSPEYRRVIEKMGVPSTELETAKEAMLSDFLKNASDYLSAPDFPARLAAVARSKNRKKTRHYSEH